MATIQKPYRSGIAAVPDNSTDLPLFETAFGADWVSTLKGAPSSLIIQFGRDISYKLISTSNDTIDSLNTFNTSNVLRFNDMQTWITDTVRIPEIYVTNNSGGADSIQVTIFANRFK